MKNARSQLTPSRRSVFFLVCICGFSTLGFSLFPLSWDGPGTSAFYLLRVGQNVRAASLADASLALPGNTGCISSNPAALAGISELQFAFAHKRIFSGLSNEAFCTALPARSGCLGLGLIYNGDSDIESWNEHNQPLAPFSTHEAAATLAYGTRLNHSVWLGLSAKALWQNLATQSGYGAGGDLGFFLRLPRSFSLGLAARNFGLFYQADEKFSLPSELGLGISWSSSRFAAVTDFLYPLDSRPNLRAGIEYLPLQQLTMRLGYRTGPADITSLGWNAGLTTGIGINLAGFSLDYCFASYGKLGPAHHIGVSFRFHSINRGELLITVTDAQTHEPLWAGITLSGVTRLRTGTNSSGQLRLSSLPVGLLIIHTSREGYEARIDTMQITGHFPQHANLALSPLARGEIWGVLYDAQTGRTLSGTIFYKGPIYGEQQVNARQGSFMLKQLPVGAYELTAFGPDSTYSAQTCTLQVTKNRVTEKLFYLYRSTR